MKKLVVAAVAALFTTVVNAQVNDGAVQFNDPDYSAKLSQRYYTDKYLYSYGEFVNEFDCASLKKHGTFIGIVAGVQTFDGKVTPNVGATVGWEGKWYGFDYVGTFAKGDYTSEADRSNSYVEFDSKLAIKLKLLDTKKHNWQLWLGAYGSYKLNFDYHENSNTVVTVRETEDEIVTTTDKVGSNYEFKGSTMGYGGQLELVYRPYMSKFNYRLLAFGGMQQRYYDDGNSFKPEFGAEVKVTYNFDAQMIWDTVFLKNSGVTKKQVKEYNKHRRNMNAY